MGALSETDREGLRQIIENDWVEASLAHDWDTSLALCSQDFVYTAHLPDCITLGAVPVSSRSAGL